jgi:Recombination endonuclease VII
MRLSRKKWKEANREKEKLRLSVKNLRFKLKNPLYSKNKHLLEKYGITYEDYCVLYNKQEGNCCICRVNHPLSSKIFTEILNVDHSHITGKVRGLLCHKCNKALGLLNDDPTVLQNAINYLKES